MRDIDHVIKKIQLGHPAVEVQQLKVSHPGDDDGLWYFEQPGSEYDVQVESWNGMCPFVIETDENDARLTANSIDETVEAVTRLLHLNAT